MSAQSIPFIDLKAQRDSIRNELDGAIGRVLDHGVFIMGPEVAELETALSEFCGSKECITCANGTDALSLVMAAEKIRPGDAVFVPAFTFVATAEVLPALGAVPYFVDVEYESCNMDTASLQQAINAAKKAGHTPRMIVAVDLFGLPADYDTLAEIAREHGLVLVADAAQSFGASYRGRSVGTLADYTTVSFFPAKPLGCYGDGGAVFTDDVERANLLRSLRFHGKGEDKYDNVHIGFNSRLDTIQAAILLEKLKIFPGEIKARNKVAARYNEALAHQFSIPVIPQGDVCAWAQYTLKSDRRDAIQTSLKNANVPTVVYYPIPLNHQTAYKMFPSGPGGVPTSETLAKSVFSLPMHPYLDEATQDDIISAVLAAAG